ncbi:MAG: hypothetical protein KBC30_09250 [Planctomycetes bacterium]|nr:hypothetical protein [Planctomycetota bacterium]HPY74614.1 hypothetical protein [Planctomycetota bacterium]HQB00254.1 hypothetical protein [Planctomycetota bacterium]
MLWGAKRANLLWGNNLALGEQHVLICSGETILLWGATREFALGRQNCSGECQLL